MFIPVALTHGAQFKFPNQTFSVPDGFEVELICAPPLIQRPISAAFDEQGRLYVTDSSGSNDKPDKQLQDKPHRIVRLEDTKGDGHFDKAILFADKMMFPEGCMWYDGSVYVAAPPSIWKLTDTNNDGVADVRTEWHQGKTLTGCANDLHGPYLGPDGWFYWCKGAFAQQTYELPGGRTFTSRAAHIFRARPDHSGLEPVMTGGMDNPVGLAFTAEGERILCGTFFDLSAPGRRDGLIHAIYGGVYGKVNEVTDEHKKTGDLMPVMTQMGPAAPCAVIRYESRVFGREYQDNLFVCCFNYHKVTRHILEPDGATFKTKDSDFLVSDNPDFHPTDVIEDADGSLIVIDTGGWYKICCPTSQLSKPDVLGAIYRVRRVRQPKAEDPRGLKIQWSKLKPEQLTPLLGDGRVFVQRHAIQELAKRGDSAVAALRQTVESGPRLSRNHGKPPEEQALSSGASERDIEILRDEYRRTEAARLAEWPKGAAKRQKAVWALTRIDSAGAREAVRSGLGDLDIKVRCAALQSASLHRDEKAMEVHIDRRDVLVMPEEERLLCELAGRAGACDDSFYHHASIPPDRILQHSFTYAMIEAGAAKTARRFLQGGGSQSSALIALDQMNNGNLRPAEVAGYLSSSDPDLRKAARWIVQHHPDWGEALADFLYEWLRSGDLSGEGGTELKDQLARFSGTPEIRHLIASSFGTKPLAVKSRVLLPAMRESPLKQWPREWVTVVNGCLEETDPGLVRSAIAVAQAASQIKTNPPDFSQALLKIGRNEARPADLRLEALAAIPNGLGDLEPALLTFLCTNVDSSKPVMARAASASVLAKAKLEDEQLLALAVTVKSAGPLEVAKLLAAFEKPNNEAVGLKLFEALKESKALASLRPDLVKSLAEKYPASVQEKANELLALLNVDAAKQKAQLEELLGELKGGDIRRGQAVFNSPKAACATCHTIGYMGGKVGPDLTSIGQARSERDLLESIVYPSASFVRSYEPMIVRTKSEEDYTGILRKDAPDEVVLVTGPNVEVRIARADIVEMRPGTVSIMPAGLDQQLSKQELADLLAFLKATKWGPR